MILEERDVPIEDNLGDDSEEVIPYKYSITSYGADYPVDGLVKRITEGSIYVPSFQRGFVWNLKESSRFVESLLLGLPVPSIFLSKERDTQKLLVIDGQQRLRTLQYFYDGVFEPTGRKFAIKGVASKYDGATYRTLEEEDKRRLDDSILHTIVVKQDEPSDDESSIYHIFERLNTGGRPLRPQEIRASIYHGEFSNVLRALNNNSVWRSVYGEVSKNMRDQELILRFLALNFESEIYAKPMKGFLNSYMGKNRYLKRQSEEEVSKAFISTVETVHNFLGPDAFKPKKILNAAVFDAVMVGVARRLDRGQITDGEALKQSYQLLTSNTEFMTACETGTANEDHVSRRLSLAIQAFASVA